MASDLLTTSGINSLVDSFKTSQTETKVTPLTTRKSNYQNTVSAYSTLKSKITTMQSIMSDLSATGSDSVFANKKVSSSNSSFVTATATGSAASSVYALRVSQLAKNDTLLTNDFTSADTNSLTGTHTFTITAGDGKNGVFTSHVSVTFGTGETNLTAMQKIAKAINYDKADITSTAFNGSDSYTGGASTLDFNLNGTEKQITVNGGGTYSDLIDEMVTNINNSVSGVTASKVTNSDGTVQLKVSADSASNYLSISDVSGNALASAMSINKTEEKGAGGMLKASIISPSNTTSKLSLTDQNSGLDYHIMSISDDSGSSALNSFNLNLGNSRPSFVQNTSGDTTGYMYADVNKSTSVMNAKFTLNGLSMERNSNSISDAATGVTFKLLAVMDSSDSDADITVSADSDTMNSKINTFIDQFNSLYSYLKTNSKSSKADDGTVTRGTLQNDTTANAMLNYMSSIAYRTVTGVGADSYKSLSQIGLSFNVDSGLTISNASTLSDALTNNSSAVEQLFNSTNGVATKLYSTLTSYVGTTGYLTKSITSLNDSISRTTDSITAAQTSIDKAAESLRSQYIKLQMEYSTLLTNENSYSSLFSSISSG